MTGIERDWDEAFGSHTVWMPLAIPPSPRGDSYSASAKVKSAAAISTFALKYHAELG
jgi:hypothetical protein